jgi:hypothetical protein
MPTTRRRATWPTSVIYTPRELDRKRRSLDRRNCSAAQVIGQMRDGGATLHLSHSPRPHWRLSSGEFVTDEVARAVIALPAVVDVGDALFAGELGQTFRFAEVGAINEPL